MKPVDSDQSRPPPIANIASTRGRSCTLALLVDVPLAPNGQERFKDLLPLFA